MRIKLHFMGPLKQRFVSRDCPEPNCEMEINEKATPRDLLRLFGVEDNNILTVVNGRPVDPDVGFSEGDRVVLMDPNYSSNSN